jgi:hypothetical protein
MDTDNEGHYEAVPMTCFACAARESEQRSVSERIDTADNRGSGKLSRESVDGVYIGVAERGVR